ncbi:MAG: hypothetical protein AB7K24_31880 [Gemmataceae bacterium]
MDGLSDLPSDYIDLLKLSDGIQAGEVVFYASGSLDQYQSLADLLPRGMSRWLIIGHLAHQTIALDRQTGALHLFNIRGAEDDSVAYHRVDHFLESVFGQDYLNLAGYQDDWYRLLVQLGLATAAAADTD